MKKFYVTGTLISKGDKWIYDFFEIPATAYEDVTTFLEDANGEDVMLIFDSPGGLITSGANIYDALRAYTGKSTAHISSISASASSFAMLGADRVTSSPIARVMIHNAASRAEGDYRDMEAARDRLINANNSFINAYQLKTGKSRGEIQTLLDKTTYMTAQEALEHGFIDEITLKEGEELEPLIAAALPGGIDINKMHELAVKYKDNPEQLLKQREESGGESGPVSDALNTQRQEFNKLRKKILNRATAETAVF